MAVKSLFPKHIKQLQTHKTIYPYLSIIYYYRRIYAPNT